MNVAIWKPELPPNFITGQSACGRDWSVAIGRQDGSPVCRVYGTTGDDATATALVISVVPEMVKVERAALKLIEDANGTPIGGCRAVRESDWQALMSALAALSLARREHSK